MKPFDKKAELRREQRPRWWLFGIIVILILAISVVTVVNVGHLEKTIDKRTNAYMKDVSLEVAKNIDYRLAKVTENLTMLEDSLARMDTLAERHEFLERKAPMLGFTYLVEMDARGNVCHADGLETNLSHLSAFQQSMKGEPSVAFLEGQTVLYTIPMWQDGAVTGVLAGARDRKNMQAFIDSGSFGGQGVSCIIDQEGQVLISPTDLRFFLALDDVFQDNRDAALVRDIEQMKRNMRSGVDGDLAFTTVDGQQVLMSYNVLSAYDWILLTLIPADIISREINQNLLATLLITGATLLTFSVIILLMLYFYKSYRRHLDKTVFEDPITGKMNNLRFLQVCEEAIREAPPSTYCMVSLNIKDFKLINENYGRDEGDNALRYIYRTLEKQLRDGEIIARGEADNFYLCLKESRPEAAQERLDAMIQAVNAYNSGTQPLYRFRILQGIYLVDDPSLEIRAIQDRANIARSNVTPENDQGFVFYNDALILRLKQERELFDLLDSSLENGDFRVYLQPKILLDSGKIGGAEALIRWRHPQRGLISPAEFVPLFERNGAICRLNRFVFEEVCAFQEKRQRQGLTLFPISVNLSRQNFRDHDFLHEFDEVRKRHHLSRNVMELELTESIVFDGGEIQYVKSVITQMHKMGFLCSLDDFGFGYSSLGLLSELDVDTVKLDRIFFNGDARSEAVVESMVNLCRNLHIRTVAEGIESPDQLEFLRRIRCDMVQGYVYAKPMPEPEFSQWVKERE